jgi:hydroxyacid-oxoacid transhydrogenase
VQQKQNGIMLRSIGRLTSRTAGVNALSSVSKVCQRSLGSSIPASGSGIYEPEYAFEMASSSIRFGRGSTKEIGYDVSQFLGIKDKVCVVTDTTMATLPPVKKVLESLTKAGVSYEVFDQVQVEPTDASLQVAIKFCQQRQFKAFVAVGGGSVIDTAKAANLYMCYPDNDILDFVNAPIGKGMPVPGALKPLIAVPTTAGTGSETTGNQYYFTLD